MTLYSKNIQFRLLSIRQKFPGFDSRLNQIQGVHLKSIYVASEPKFTNTN